MTNPRSGGGTERTPQRSAGHHCWKGTATKEAARFPQLTPPPRIGATFLETSGCRRQHWDFTKLEPFSHCISLWSWGVGPWYQNNWILGAALTYTGSTGHFPLPCRDLKSQGSAREQKQNKTLCDSRPLTGKQQEDFLLIY